MRTVKPKHVLSSMVLATSALGFVLPAHAFEFKVSGQVDRAITAANNGENSDIGFVDNAGSNSRFRFTGSQEMGNGLTLGFAYEIGLGTNPSSGWDINDTATNPNFFDNRQANVFVKGAFGKFTLGKHDGAANATSEVNYSGTEYLGGGVDFIDYAGGISFLDDDGNVISSLGSAFNSFDALSRQNEIRYDSPSIGGTVLSASLDEGHAYELAARYETAIGDGGKFGVAGDYLDSERQGSDIQPNGIIVSRGPRFREFGGSASLLLPSGLNFTASYKRRNFIEGGDPDATNYFGGVGYIIGQHHFEVSYDRTSDFLNDGSKANAYGAAYVFNWTKSVQLYASYHLYQLNDASDGNGNHIDAQNINQIYLGTRVKFL